MADATASSNKLEFLNELKSVNLNDSAEKIIRSGGKTGRQESYKQALFELSQSFEDRFVDAVEAAFNLHPSQSKKVRYKKDRIRVFKQHDIDYLTIDGVETAQILAQIAQAIHYDDAIVSKDLNDSFPFWKEGYPMVQFDNVYKILAEDIQVHYQAVLDQLIKYISK
ncbi:MAG: hypothetical protein QM666_08825 [Acinetobacter sp.]